MSALRTWLRISASVGLLIFLAALAAACDDDGASSGEPTATAASVDATEDPAADRPAVGTEESVDLGTEAGLAPIYWRTQDTFQSVVAGEPYKVVVRVTGGFEEESLAVTATGDAGEDVTFTARRTEVGEGEDPGSYYAFDLILPEAGLWQVTTNAGTVEITIEVKPAT